MQVKEVMSRRIIAISPEETVAVAARLLSQHNIGALPVCSRGRAAARHGDGPGYRPALHRRGGGPGPDHGPGYYDPELCHSSSGR